MKVNELKNILMNKDKPVVFFIMTTVFTVPGSNVWIQLGM